MLGNVGNMAKMVKTYRQTQNRLKALKAAGVSKDETIAVLMDGRMKIIEVEVKEEAEVLKAKELSKNFMQAYKAASKELERLLKENTSPDDIREMLGMS